jgi:hypothetical protein
MSTEKLEQTQNPGMHYNCNLHGLTTWIITQTDSSIVHQSPTIGSFSPVDIAITQAYYKQIHVLGWDNLLRGRSSTLWNKAYLAYKSLYNNNPLTTTSWVATIIPSLWEYTAALWEHRNGILHGHTIQVMETKELEAIRLQITAAYVKYSKDRFIISRYLSSLFTSWSLKQRLSRDIDSMKC